MSHVNGSDEESSRTASTTGASFMPDSSSNAPESRLLTPTPRSTLKTAAASVEDSTAPHSSAVRHSRPSRTCSAAPTTPMLTSTDTVESATPRPSEGRTARQLVVSPPSARMRTSAARPSDSVSAASLNSMPSTDSPSTIPMPR